MSLSAACECVAKEQTTEHVVLHCPIHRPPYGVHDLAILDDKATEWLLNACPEIKYGLWVDWKSCSYDEKEELAVTVWALGNDILVLNLEYVKALNSLRRVFRYFHFLVLVNRKLLTECFQCRDHQQLLSKPDLICVDVQMILVNFSERNIFSRYRQEQTEGKHDLLPIRV